MGDTATWVGAVATFLAVLVALRLHVKFFPPLLRLRLLSQDGRATPVSMHTMEGPVILSTRQELGRYYHVELSNGRPIIPATNPNVYLVAVEQPDASGAFAEIWSGAMPIVATYFGVHPSRTLGADPQLYDLCSVVRGKWVQLHPQIATSDFPQNLKPEEGKSVVLRVILQARSLEAVSSRFKYEIAWDGKWSEDTLEMRRHMVVKPS